MLMLLRILLMVIISCNYKATNIPLSCALERALKVHVKITRKKTWCAQKMCLPKMILRILHTRRSQ